MKIKSLLPYISSMSSMYTGLDDFEDKTVHGIDKLLLMIKLIKILEGDDNKAFIHLGQLKTWLYQQLKRKLTTEENVALLEGIIHYCKSEPATDDRRQAMDYLFNAKFITN